MGSLECVRHLRTSLNLSGKSEQRKMHGSEQTVVRVGGCPHTREKMDATNLGDIGLISISFWAKLILNGTPLFDILIGRLKIYVFPEFLGILKMLII